MKKINIFIVDDHALVRQGIINVLETDSRYNIVGEADNSVDAIKRILGLTNLDIVIMDIDLPGRDGLETLIQIKEHNPELKVLILSMYSEKQYALRALKAGASGYLMKGRDTNSLLDGLNLICQGKKYISAEVSDLLVDSIKGGSHENSMDVLSYRELQVLRFIGKGLKQKEIALKLSLSSKTVSTYKTRIKEKLGLDSTAELVTFCINNKIL